MKARTRFVCCECGAQSPKWLGRCPGCGAWSTLQEEAPARGAEARKPKSAQPQLLPITRIEPQQHARAALGIAELDRVLGGGLVRGALVLVGGDPGIGKSTLLLQAAGRAASQGMRVLYATAEESLHQVKLRADRLGVSSDALYLIAETQLEVLEQAREELQPELLIVDSIQTVGTQGLEGAVGSVGQIRAVTQHLMTAAKGHGMTTFVVGHVTKEGAIAGPKVMEHMVDTVLYFEGERTGPYRILRAHKNRFGSAQEIGVFEMQSEGLQPVNNPSELFLSQRAEGPGATVVTSVEGSRPILLEVQALTTPTLYGTPRRTTIGVDTQRVSMLGAVLDRHTATAMAGLDVYVNVAGGVRIQEPAADLGVALALASASSGQALPADTVVVGEVGLSGEVRAVAQLPVRIQEAQALGFQQVVVPRVDLDRWRGPPPGLPTRGVGTVREALDAVGLRQIELDRG